MDVGTGIWVGTAKVICIKVSFIEISNLNALDLAVRFQLGSQPISICRVESNLNRWILEFES